LSCLLASKYWKKKIILIQIVGEHCHIHARRQDKKEDLGKLIKSLVEGLEEGSGGGHVPAAGGHFLFKDIDKFRERLDLN
jgi:single-stranded DNA-specific DHH superfamily exonuclease